MNLLDMNVKDNLKYIIDAYTRVFGEEYRALITKRINNIIFIMYNNPDGMKSYVEFLKKCKQKELAVKFLEKIGIDTQKYEIKSYAEELDDELKKLILEYIGNYSYMESKLKSYTKGIKMWDDSCTRDNAQETEELQIRFINFIRGENKAKITKENYKEFQKTEEYREILGRIQEWLQIYDKIIEEYEAYIQEIAPYQKYIDDEEKRKKDIYNARIEMIYLGLGDIIPEGIETFLDSHFSDTLEQARRLIGDDLGIKTYMEYFSKEDEEDLQDEEVSEETKALIYFFRTCYFKEMGIKLKNEIDEFASSKELYESYISQDDAKQIIPPAEFVSEITRTKRNRI